VNRQNYKIIGEYFPGIDSNRFTLAKVLKAGIRQLSFSKFCMHLNYLVTETSIVITKAIALQHNFLKIATDCLNIVHLRVEFQSNQK
jgi:hypothetical protein